MNFQSIRQSVLRAFTALGITLAVITPNAAVAQAQEQYFGIPSSRVGPYSAMGTGFCSCLVVKMAMDCAP